VPAPPSFIAWSLAASAEALGPTLAAPGLHLAVGWVWFALGVASGAALGLGFHREGFLGGYGSWPRRLLRLGHISFFGLGLLNLCFAMTLPALGDGRGTALASAALLVGAASMPACCALAAWRRGAKLLFAVPVVSITLGVGVPAVVLSARVLNGGAP
jgi:hypothetical protein